MTQEVTAIDEITTIIREADEGENHARIVLFNASMAYTKGSSIEQNHNWPSPAYQFVKNFQMESRFRRSCLCQTNCWK